MKIKYSNKLLIVLLSALLVSLSGCFNKYEVFCDSGFSTGVSSHAYSDEGVVYWNHENGGEYDSRRMLPGEVCKTKIKKAN